MRIKNWKRRPHHSQDRPFEDLPFEAQKRARLRLHIFLQRHHPCPPWLYPILIGRARFLGQLSSGQLSAWGRSMRAKRYGYASQRKFREEGRVGKWHPAHRASRVSKARRELRKQRKQEAEERQRLDLPPKPRSTLLPLF
ncbi:MAG TPA: hypothetical protein VNJ52_00140 [Patescibacteria group bacterium]|nr:hypothetical protein [Patescibacteria group bacterium]